MENPKMRSCPSLIDKFVGSEYDTIVKIADALPMLLELYKVFQGKEDKLAMICTEIAANGNYFALTDYKNARAWGYIGDGTYHPLQEWVNSGKFSGLAAIQAAYPKVTSLTQSIDWAALQTMVDHCIGETCFIPKGVGVITDSVYTPMGTRLRGCGGKFEMWALDLTKGTVVKTYGPGKPRRLTDIDGNDPADDTAMFIAAGRSVYFENFAMMSDNWSMGMFFPSVRQCGFAQMLAYGFTDSPCYLDATNSTRNTTMCLLNPEIAHDGGMNEFTGIDFYFRTSAPGAFGVKIQGTTRPGDAVANADLWQWGWGGTSDIRFLHGRISAGGAGGGCIKHDAKMFGTSLGQGVTFRDVSLRLFGNGDYYCSFDRSNRIIIDGAYGEHSSGGVGKVRVTSNTQKSSDGILFTNDRLGGRMYLNDTDVGSLQTPDWQDTRCVQMYKVSGRISTPNLKCLDVSQFMEFTSWDTEYGFVFYFDNGASRIQRYCLSSSNFRSQIEGTNLGSSNHFWQKGYIHELISETISASDLTLNITTLNGAFVVGNPSTPVIRPIQDGGASLGTNTYPWLSVRAHNLFSDSGTVSVSDIRRKLEPGNIPDAVLDVWGNIRWIRYKLANGTSNRWHTGSIAQWILEEFTKAGLDATEYGLICHDVWEAIEAKAEQPATYDAEGNQLTPYVPAVSGQEAGDLWQVRYEEMQAMEAAWNRRELSRIKARLAALEQANNSTPA